jgi:hypothetical protein
MASETIKALLMISLFCGLQAALNLPRLIDLETVKRCRQAMMLRRPHWPAHGPISYAVTTVRGGRKSVLYSVPFAFPLFANGRG